MKTKDQVATPTQQIQQGLLRSGGITFAEMAELAGSDETLLAILEALPDETVPSPMGFSQNIPWDSHLILFDGEWFHEGWEYPCNGGCMRLAHVELEDVFAAV